MKKKKRFLLIFAMILTLLFVVTIVSLLKFETMNFVASGSGLVRIMFTNDSVVQIRKSPDIYLSKPDNAFQNLEILMKAKGYEYLPDERMGSAVVFGNQESRVVVSFSYNSYYSKWIFFR